MRTIPDPGFAGDDGMVSEAVRQALEAYDHDPGGDGAWAAAMAVLQDSRLLVPVVAALGEVEYDDHGLARDKTSEMATVLMRGRDGRLALLAFTGSEPLAAWDAGARPVPVTAEAAARAALHDGAEALVIDVAGPVRFVVEAEALRSLADGYRLMETGHGWAWLRLGDSPLGG